MSARDPSHDYAADVIVRLIHRADLELWLDQGWRLGLPWWHPVQAAYGKCYIWRSA
jgi:hypothetical protein